ncbi:MAG TPA: hypothetical protein VMK12_10155 [Anaeromyxobacteraceae bacterium]|nr:hypothetical protein [Anaeromyxobacteraceae bacterium]
MEFVCTDPTATVRGANVRSTLDAFSLLPLAGRALLTRHGLKPEDLREDQFLPLQRWLNALREIDAEVGPSVMRKIGSHVIENADFPPAFADVESILLALDEIYHVNHRGEVGHYSSSRDEDGTIRVRCETPYPRQFERGLVEGICRSRRADGRRFSVEFIEGPNAGNLTCTLLVRAEDVGG